MTNRPVLCAAKSEENKGDAEGENDEKAWEIQRVWVVHDIRELILLVDDIIVDRRQRLEQWHVCANAVIWAMQLSRIVRKHEI